MSRTMGPGNDITIDSTSIRAGATNMLVNCADAKPGERLLIAHEPESEDFYDFGLVPQLAQIAADLGLTVQTFDVGYQPLSPTLPPALLDQISVSDIVVFFARLGDQLRFGEMPAGKRIVVSYALDQQMLASGFGQVDFRAFDQLKEVVNSALRNANHVQVTCPRGTDFSGRPQMPAPMVGDTSILRFPLSIFTPVPAREFSGRVALAGFLTGTGSQYYAPYTVEFFGRLAAIFENGRLIGFEGDAGDVSKAAQHYDHVSDLFGIERDLVHSWHAGIHPGCGYKKPAQGNYEQWSGSAFGNPRLLHFHTCGDYAPGEISWNVVDPTIQIDGVPVWVEGVLHPERLTGGQEILDQYPEMAHLFANPDRDIGL